MSKFYLGMDIGTNSVGMACTDENYNLLRAKRQDLWTVRLFDEGKTATARRTFRTARRRLERRKQRIKWLQEIFAPYISDKTFFIRLNNSQFLTEDKDILLKGDKNTLFGDSDFSDKDFHARYKTVYHLRKALIENTAEKFDIRLYYLAIHHIIKYRGHFLYEGSASENPDIKDSFISLFAALNDYFGDYGACSMQFGEEYIDGFTSGGTDYSGAKSIILSQKSSKEKQKELEKLFDAEKFEQIDDAEKSKKSKSRNPMKEIIKALVGYKFAPADIFAADGADENSEKASVSFNKMSDEEFESMRTEYDASAFAVLEAIRGVYNFAQFKKILGGASNISSAMTAIYEKHKNDLKILKKFIKTYCSAEDYTDVFKSLSEKNNYVYYIGYTKKGGDKKKVEKKCGQEDLCKYLRGRIKVWQEKYEIPDDAENFAYIKSETEKNEFLPLILHSDSGLIPEQSNRDELIKIVENLAKNYPETREICFGFGANGDCGVKNGKILKLFLYKIPYYVGPLSYVGITDENSAGHRACRKEGKEHEKITPWNFDDVIDKEKSSEAFMRRMTNKCTYLRGEDVLPKNSIIYQKFDVLNQLNKLKINEAAISEEVKKKLFDGLFLNQPKVRDKAIKDFLVRECGYSEKDKNKIVLSGKNGEFNASMSSYCRFSKIFGEEFVSDPKNLDIFEDIILWHTLNTDKSVVENLIRKKYGKNEKIISNISALKGLTFKDFGRLSARFLTEMPIVNKSTGEITTILAALYDENLNLNELIFDEKYNVKEQLDKENGKSDEEVTYADVEELYVSPSVKRGIWQSLKMADEYVKLVGKQPEKVFIEVTRENNLEKKGKETVSRAKSLQKIYADYKNIIEAEDYGDVYNALFAQDFDNLKLRSEKIFLYYRQLGRCAYSGERIDLNRIDKDYDVDHIIPRTYLKDDSLLNKVLVKKERNHTKSDEYPLPESYQTERNIKFWKLLKECKLIEPETYARLTRVEPLNENDFNYFINRQKVITDQTAKAVAEFMARKYQNSIIVYSKAKNVSEFRQEFSLHKCRETNDLHHARDAYLNIVVGNVFYANFNTPLALFYRNGSEWRNKNLKNLFKKATKDAWDPELSPQTVEKVYAKHTMTVTRMALINKGGFSDQNASKKGDKALIPRKQSEKSVLAPLKDVSKYGGYSGRNTAYFAVVQSLNKSGKKIKTIEAIPVYVFYKSKTDPDAVKLYLSEYLTSPEIIVNQIKMKQLASYNGTPLYLAGVTDENISFYSAVEFFTDNKTDEYFKEVKKLLNIADSQGLEEKDSYPMKTNSSGETKLTITKESNMLYYRMLAEQLGKKYYLSISAYKNAKSYIDGGFEKFADLTIIKQCKVLMNILGYLQCKGNVADLLDIGGKKGSGKLRFNKNITDVDFRIIKTSLTGVLKHEIKV